MTRATRTRTPEPWPGCGRVLYLTEKERVTPKRWYCTKVCAEQHHSREGLPNKHLLKAMLSENLMTE